MERRPIEVLMRPWISLAAAAALLFVAAPASARKDDLPAPPPGQAPEKERPPPPSPPPEVPPLPPKAAPPPPEQPPPAQPAPPPPIQPAAPPPVQPAPPPLVQPAPPPVQPAAPPTVQPAPTGVPPLPPPGAGPPPPGKPLPAARKPATLAHAGQFIFHFSFLELPYLFHQVTQRSANDRRIGWMPTLGFGYGAGSGEYILKFGGGVNAFADDNAFMFGIERRNYIGSGVFKGMFFFNLMFGTGSHVTFYQMFNLGVGFQIDPSRRYGFFVAFGPGFVTTLGGDAPAGSNNSDAAFVVVTHFGIQLRI